MEVVQRDSATLQPTTKLFLVHWKEHVAGIFRNLERARECAARHNYNVDEIETDLP